MVVICTQARLMTGQAMTSIGGQKMKQNSGSGIIVMRSSFAITALLLALAGCATGVAPRGQGEIRQQPASGQWPGLSLATPMGGGEYQRHLRARDNASRSGAPYSVPPENRGAQTGHHPPVGGQGAPLGAPMRAQAGSAASSEPARPMTDEGLRDSTLAQQQLFDPGRTQEAATSHPAPQTGTGIETTVPLVRVTDASAAEGPNIVAYALNTHHPVGTERYPRRNPLRWQIWERNCLQFANQNAAQEAFLAAGGPERDRHNLDPVGDGYACWWDPEPIRKAMGGG